VLSAYGYRVVGVLCSVNVCSLRRLTHLGTHADGFAVHTIDDGTVAGKGLMVAGKGLMAAMTIATWLQVT
jgi:hypothetical protein